MRTQQIEKAIQRVESLMYRYWKLGFGDRLEPTAGYEVNPFYHLWFIFTEELRTLH